MPKMTLLKMVQTLLSDINSEEVNTISDGVEAMQVANILEAVYYEIVNQSDKKFLGKLGRLEASGNASLPTFMYIPEDIKKIEWIKYNSKKDEGGNDQYREIEYLYQDQFLDVLDARNTLAPGVTVCVTPELVTLNIVNNQPPSYWTSFDDNTIIFDSYDSNIETTLSASKTKVYGYKEPAFVIADDFIPEFPAEMFPYYLAEARSVVFNDLAQSPNPKAEQRRTRAKNFMGIEGWRAKGGLDRNYYGRKRWKL